MVKDGAKTMKGNFTYIGLDIDTTGRRLIDEIVNISAYSPNAQYSQHIMPLMNLNPGARQRHQVRVINVGCFRMLKCMQTYKVIKTKTEIAAMLEFLDWLETVNVNDGIIFVYHDQLKFTPYMVIEAMKKYRLLERFQKSVKGFANGYDLSDEKQGEGGMKYLLLSQNLKIHREKLGIEHTEVEGFEGEANVRAKLSYEICMVLAHGAEKKEVDEKAMAAIVNDFIKPKARPISNELDEIKEQEQCIERQSTLRDIFRGYFQASRYHRRRAVNFRRQLSEAALDLDALQKIWDEGKRDAIAEKVKAMESVKEEDKEELVEILDSHFDPEKKAVKPVVQRRENNDRNNDRNDRNDRQSNNGNPRGNGNGNPRRRRGGRARSPNKENQGGPRSNSRRKSTSDKRPEKRYNNNNNNNEAHQKTGIPHKDQRQNVDMNQNAVLVGSN